jgi:hypothetical protein
MEMIDIYMTSFFRKDMTARAVNEIHDRTEKGSFQIHIYDNGSDKETREFLVHLFDNRLIASLMLDSRNTGCLYNKLIFHAMTESSSPYYVVTDNDIYPPKLSPDWLSRMVAIMEKYPKLAMLTPQFPPAQLMGPLSVNEDVAFCKAVGNAFKLVRRDLFPFEQCKQKLGSYGDDGMVSSIIMEQGNQVAFCRNIFCLHAGQTENWGYKPEEIGKDPRKSGYGKPFIVPIADQDTYTPKNQEDRL